METKKLIEMSSFWHNKTDDECVELATNQGICGSDFDAEQALINMIENYFWTETNANYINELTKQVLMEKYVKEGVREDKIIITNEPSTANWSLSRKCLVGENGVEALEVIDEEDGNKRLSFQNNVWISMSVRTTLTKEDIDTINNSNGIVCTSYSGGFRYGFIPS